MEFPYLNLRQCIYCGSPRMVNIETGIPFAGIACGEKEKGTPFFNNGYEVSGCNLCQEVQDESKYVAEAIRARRSSPQEPVTPKIDRVF